MAAPFLIIYDNDCAFCCRWVRWILRMDSSGKFYFAAGNSRTGKQMLRRLGLEGLQKQTIILVLGEHYYLYSEAIRQIGLHISSLHWLASMAGCIPQGLRDRVYQMIAHHRHRLSASVKHCPLPPLEYRHRFLP